MALTYEDKIAEVKRQWRADFALTAMEQVDDWAEHARVIEPDGTVPDEVNFYWVSENMVDTIDDGKRRYVNPEVYKTSVSTDRYRPGFRVDADAWRKPNVGDLYRGSVRNLAKRPGVTKHRTFWDFLTQGNTDTYGTAWDGQYFFDTDHPGKDKSGAAITQANLHALALDATNFDTIATGMTNYYDPTGMHSGNSYGTLADGRPKFLVIAANKYRSTLKQMFDNERLASGATNEYYGEAEYMVTPMLAGDTEDHWFVVMRTDDPDRKPLLYHEPYPAEFMDIMDPRDRSVYDTHAYDFGVNYRFGFGYFDWMRIALSIDS